MLRRKLPPIYDLPYTDLAADVPLGADPLPLTPGLGSTFVAITDEPLPEGEPAPTGRIALLIAPEGELRHTLVVEFDGWSVACPLSSGQLHRLTNALEGRGTRPGIRPLATTGEPVHLGGAPERLVVEHGDRRVVIPAGPKRALGKALRAVETR